MDKNLIRRANANFRWPNGAQIALVFNIACEAWSDGEAPGIGPMGNVLKPGFFDTNAHSWASYGPTRGIARLQRIVDKHGVKASVMVNGVLAERFPETVNALAAAGHEIVAHSWGMDVIPIYLDEDAETANIQRTLFALKKTTGFAPGGWISPRGTGSKSSPGLLAKEGILWFGDTNDDDLPSIVEIPGNGSQRIVSIPLTMDVNDLPHSVRYGNAPAALVDNFRAILVNSRKADPFPFMLDVTAHTHVYGRPAGAWAYDAMLALARDEKDVWIGTRAQIAEYVLANEAWFE